MSFYVRTQHFILYIFEIFSLIHAQKLFFKSKNVEKFLNVLYIVFRDVKIV